MRAFFDGIVTALSLLFYGVLGLAILWRIADGPMTRRNWCFLAIYLLLILWVHLPTKRDD